MNLPEKAGVADLLRGLAPRTTPDVAWLHPGYKLNQIE